MIELFGGNNQRQLTAFSLVSVFAKKLFHTSLTGCQIRFGNESTATTKTYLS